MKISASIYAKPKIDLALLDMLEDYKVDFIHIDCNDDMSVFDDIRWIKSKSKLPIDLHIISNKVSKFYDVLAELDIDYVTFQYENLEEELVIDSKIKSKIGIAITTNTDLKTILEIIEKYQMGFCIIVSDRNFFEGVITSGDIRRFLLKNIDTVNKEITECILNNDAVVAKDTWNVREFLEHIRSTEKNLNFVSVLDSANTLVGAVSFEKLVKGEL